MHFKEGSIVKQDNINWLCPICKEANFDHAKYCRKCGHWLLSEYHSPTRVEKSVMKSIPKQSNRKGIYNHHERDYVSKLLIIELISIIILSFLIFNSEDSIQQAIPFIFVWIFIIHVLFSLIYVVKSLFQYGFLGAGKTLLKHGGLLIVLLGISIIYNTDLDSEKIVNTDVESIKSKAIELSYDDLLRNAEGKYRNRYIKISGQVYHLENGNQDAIMIDMSPNLDDMQAVFINRKEQDQTIILNDHIVVYGKVTGTIAVINALGNQSAVPAIEGHVLLLENE